MITFVIGLFLGSLLGFFFCAILGRGKGADESIPRPQAPLPRINPLS
jgi:hypothetical protein